MAAGTVAEVSAQLADAARPGAGDRPMRTEAGPGPDLAGGPRGEASWRVVAGQEARDLWFGGRGPMLLFGFSVLMSVLTYLTASSQRAELPRAA